MSHNHFVEKPKLMDCGLTKYINLIQQLRITIATIFLIEIPDPSLHLLIPPGGEISIFLNHGEAVNTVQSSAVLCAKWKQRKLKY